MASRPLFLRRLCLRRVVLQRFADHVGCRRAQGRGADPARIGLAAPGAGGRQDSHRLPADRRAILLVIVLVIVLAWLLRAAVLGAGAVLAAARAVGAVLVVAAAAGADAIVAIAAMRAVVIVAALQAGEVVVL